MPVISVLTDPVPTGKYFLPEYFRKFLRQCREFISPRPAFMQSPYRGHFAVTRSLVEGLEALRVDYTYNPAKLTDLAPVVIVLSGVRALQQAIKLKEQGHITKLLAGPNLVNYPSDHDKLICSDAVDICLTPSDITCRFYEQDCPELAGRCLGWPAGVDSDYWSPDASDRKGILIYCKPSKGETDSYEPYLEFLEERHIEYQFIHYGNYSQEEFLGKLRKSELMVVFSREESQGIAWAEAWSVDVPTILWNTDSTEFLHPRLGPMVYRTSSAPYLTSENGAFFQNLEEFRNIITDWESGKAGYSPREWLLANMTDAVSARRLLAISGLEEASQQ